jgi:hypothetical protein
VRAGGALRLFIGVEGASGRVAGVVTTGVNGFNAIEGGAR